MSEKVQVMRKKVKRRERKEMEREENVEDV